MEQVGAAVDGLLAWFVKRVATADCGAESVEQALRSVPCDLRQVAGWMVAPPAQGVDAPLFAPKSTALVLIYHLEAGRSGRYHFPQFSRIFSDFLGFSRIFSDFNCRSQGAELQGDEASALLQAIGSMLIRWPPNKLDNADVLRAILFLVAVN